MALQTNLDFLRYEFKYILRKQVRDVIEGELKFFMDLDPYVTARSQEHYMVRSLYFDNRSFTHYYDKVDGKLTRSKFRLRTYTDDPKEGCATFIEVKGRHNNMVFKHRAPLSEGRGCIFEGGERDMSKQVIERTRPGKVLDRFNFDLCRRRIEPVMLIEYRRRPYVTRFQPEFRVTFDDLLTGANTCSLYPPDHEESRDLLPGYTIMEVKFRYHLPSWFHRIITAFELNRISISKICKGIEKFRLTPIFE
ncbi:MAG: polyphosphate polymerase domain-containing protein [Verrucomicrobia bacterium]|nr:polyphosphate polymerase domain-containing protein [Verrucomicrobiota bacterium]